MTLKVLEVLRRWDAEEVPAPEEVQLYPTNTCNLRCVFCVTTTGFYKGQREVSERRWLEVAQELCDLGVRRVLISGGGEPLLSPATLPMMALFKRHDIYGRMITNGTVWNDKSIRAAVTMGWDQVTFSIDGPDASVHDKLRAVPGCFARTVSTIREFRKVQDELGSDAPRREINCVLSRANYSDVMAMVELAADLGISHLNLEPVCMNNPHVEAIRLRKKERDELQETLLPEALRAAENHGLSTNIRGLMGIGDVDRAGEMRGFILDRLNAPDPERPFSELACYEPWLWPKIEANGEVWPCSTTPLKENILEKSFVDIWDGDVFREYRGRIMERDLPESCQNCVVSHLTTNSGIRSRLRENLESSGSLWEGYER